MLPPLFFASVSAPASSSSRKIASWPWSAALMRGVTPIYCRSKRAHAFVREREAHGVRASEKDRAREREAAVAGEGAGGPRACAASSQALSAAPFATERERVCRAVGCAFADRAVAHSFILEGRLLREEPPHVLRPAGAGRLAQLQARVHFAMYPPKFVHSLWTNTSVLLK